MKHIILVQGSNFTFFKLWKRNLKKILVFYTMYWVLWPRELFEWLMNLPNVIVILCTNWAIKLSIYYNCSFFLQNSSAGSYSYFTFLSPSQPSICQKAKGPSPLLSPCVWPGMSDFSYPKVWKGRNKLKIF